MANTDDYNFKSGKHNEGIADGHMKTREWKKAAVLYKKSFINFKNGGCKEDCIRLKAKFDEAKSNLDSGL